MTFLELCKQLVLESGIPGTGPTSTTGQSGEMARVVNWIQMAYREIQLRPGWEWMRTAFSFETVAEQGQYTIAEAGISDFSAWKPDSFRIYLTSAGVGSETLLTQSDYTSFRDYYLFNTRRTSYSRPIAIAVTPNKSLVLGLAPDDIYTVSGEYWKSPQALSGDSDTPDMPDRFHMAIVYKALLSYGLFESAGEVIQRAQLLYGQYDSAMRADQQGEITLAGGLM